MKVRNLNMLAKGDKIVLTHEMGMFTNIGEICEIIDVNEAGIISFKFGNGMHLGCMSADEFEKYFGRQADKRRKLYNGMIKCQLFMYFKQGDRS